MKVTFIQADKDGALERSSECMKTGHNMTIIVQTICVDVSSLNRNSESPNKKLANNKGALLLN